MVDAGFYVDVHCCGLRHRRNGLGPHISRGACWAFIRWLGLHYFVCELADLLF